MNQLIKYGTRIDNSVRVLGHDEKTVIHVRQARSSIFRDNTEATYLRLWKAQMRKLRKERQGVRSLTKAVATAAWFNIEGPALTSMLFYQLSGCNSAAIVQTAINGNPNGTVTRKARTYVREILAPKVG